MRQTGWALLIGCFLAIATAQAIAQGTFTQPAPIPTQPGLAPQPRGGSQQNGLPPTPFPNNGTPAPAAGQANARTEVRLTWTDPRPVVVSIGSQVRTAAMLTTSAGQPLPGQRIDFQLAQNGAGQFLADQPVKTSFFSSSAVKVVDARNAYGETLKEPVVVGVGPSAVTMPPGSLWIGITSATEGISQVRASLHDIQGPANNVTRTIFWVDANWTAPPDAHAALGAKMPLVTKVFRHSNAQPIGGWRVRYELVGGPECGFGPGAAKSADVKSDEQGLAALELNSPAKDGTSDIKISVFEPARREVVGAEELMIGTSVAHVVWGTPSPVPTTGSTAATAQPINPQNSAQPLTPGGPPPGTLGQPAAQTLPTSNGGLTVFVRGPDQAAAGTQAEYVLDVENNADKPIDRVTLTFNIPSGATVADTQPQSQAEAGKLSWDLGQLGPQEKRVFKTTLNVNQPGVTSTMVAKAELLSGDGRLATHSRSLLVRGPLLDINITSPTNVTVGGEAKFNVSITNRGQSPANNLVITDSYDDGLESDVPDSKGKISNDKFGSLDPNQTKSIVLKFRVLKQGELSHALEVTGDGGIRVNKTATIRVADTASVGPPTIALKKTGPLEVKVGDTAVYIIEVSNNTGRPIPKLQLADHYDLRFPPREATEDCDFKTPGELHWIIEDLQPGETKKRQVRCEATAAVNRLCTLTTVDVLGLEQKRLTSCVTLVGDGTSGAAPPPVAPVGPSQVTLSIAERDNPVLVGRETVYYLTVVNKGRTPDRQVSLSVTVPSEATILNQIKGDLAEAPRGQTIRFADIAELKAGETFKYEIPVLVQKPGDVMLRAELTSRGLPRPIVKEKPTKFLPVQ